MTFLYFFATCVVLSPIAILLAFKHKSYPLALFGAVMSVPLSLYLAASPIFYFLPLIFPPLIGYSGKLIADGREKAALTLMAPYILSASCVVWFGYVLSAFE